MTYTEKYSLNVPTLADKADITKISENFTTLDEVISDLSNSVDNNVENINNLEENTQTLITQVEAVRVKVDAVESVVGTFRGDIDNASANAASALETATALQKDVSDLNNFKKEQNQINTDLEELINAVSDGLTERIDNSIGDINSILATVVSGGAE